MVIKCFAKVFLSMRLSNLQVIRFIMLALDSQYKCCVSHIINNVTRLDNTTYMLFSSRNYSGGKSVNVSNLSCFRLRLYCQNVETVRCPCGT